MSSNTFKKIKASEASPLPITDQVYETISIKDLSDPIAKQYLPSPEENIVSLTENRDPIGDDRFSPVKGLVHRYPDRVLLKITDTCAVYCRFCFRKEMIGKGAGILSSSEINNALHYIKENNQIHEVILSGGDPLTISNRRLKELLDQLEKINHLDIIRIHTRAPMVTPKRIDQQFLDIINNCSKAIYIVIHVNHAQEINDNVKNVFALLIKTKATLLSQSVLLKNVNDTVENLENLFRTLVANNIKPYYLHHPDLAIGTGHFRVSIQKGQSLMKALRGKLSGLCLPTYVLDIPGGYGKVPIGDCHAKNLDGNSYIIEDYLGENHSYHDSVLGND